MNQELLDRIKQAIKDALQEFGKYSFSDKGAHEVMDLPPFVEELNALDVEECKAVLVVLAEGTDFEQQFATDVLMEMQDVPEERYDALLAEPKLLDLF